MTVALRRAWAKDLDVPTLYALLKLRVEVFVVEQARPYPELDGRDLLTETRHFWLADPEGEVICTLRLMEEYPGGHKAFRLGRLCTKRSARGEGHTTRLLRAALAEVGDYPCRINAQVYLADMYSQHGFVRDGDDFLDDGVPHVPMLRPRRAGLTSWSPHRRTRIWPACDWPGRRSSWWAAATSPNAGFRYSSPAEQTCTSLPAAPPARSRR